MKNTLNTHRQIIASVALTVMLLFTFGLSSCSREDDLDEIFVGRTWYMNGAKVNGLKLNSEIKQFYTDAGESAYYISFMSGTFQGALSAGVTFAGTWSADGKKQTIQLNVTTKPATTSTFDKQIFNIISSASSYNSGADFLQMDKDDNNYVMFGSSRNKVYN